MELNPDTAYSLLKKIADEFKDFCSTYGAASEADTRVKLIDKILIEVCGWPESKVRREVHSSSGFSDYILDINGKNFVVVEAKKEGESFLFPVGNRSRTLKLNGTILTDKAISAAINQVRGYCDDKGIRYATE